jgi:putative nucleotidyltransferase-like protein
MADTQGGTALPALPERFRLSPEFRLLVACSWVNPQAQAERIIYLSGERIDWDEFIELVDRHRVPVLAYAALRRHANECLPNDIREKLKERSDQARKQALRYAVELVRLIKMFAGNSIEVIPLKGLILSQRLFGDTGMRQLNDIDLMVRHEDLDLADRFLGLEGYRRISPGFELTKNQKKYLMTGIHHYEYVHNERCLNLELHWRSFLWTPEQAAELWNSCQPAEWMGLRVKCLDDDALLLYLCDHGAGHKWFRIKWLSDIAMILAQDRPNGWDNLLAMADRFDLRRVLAQTALLVHWLYEVSLPRPLSRLIEEETASVSLASIAITAILTSEVDHATGGRRFEYVKRTRYLIRLKPSLPYGMVLKGVLISPQDIKEIPLPSSIFWFYIPLRPVFWVWRNYLRK